MRKVALLLVLVGFCLLFFLIKKSNKKNQARPDGAKNKKAEKLNVALKLKNSPPDSNTLLTGPGSDNVDFLTVNI